MRTKFKFIPIYLVEEYASEVPETLDSITLRLTRKELFEYENPF